MEKIIIQVQNKKKAKMLSELLAFLDFITSIKTSEDLADSQQMSLVSKNDFFSFAGLWADRDISIDNIRQKAWPKK